MVGRNKFFHPSTTERPFDIGRGLEAWRGFDSSVRPVHKQLMVNVNVCTTACYKPGNLRERMDEYLGRSFKANPEAFVVGVKVKMIHLGYTKTIQGVSNETALTHKFDHPKYGNVSVKDYFQRGMPSRDSCLSAGVMNPIP